MTKDKTTGFGLIIGGILLLLIGSCSAGIAYGTSETIEINITKTERISTGSGDEMSHKYLVFTDNETFENTDTIWYMKYNSSDIYGKLKEGKHKAKVYGWRIPFISSYRNIIEIQSLGE